METFHGNYWNFNSLLTRINWKFSKLKFGKINIVGKNIYISIILPKMIRFDENTMEYLCYFSITGTQHANYCRAIEATSPICTVHSSTCIDDF